MPLMKIRRRGRSFAVTLDAETLRKARLREGDLVQPIVEKGRVVLDPAPPGVRPNVMETVRRVIEEERPVLERLAKYDAER